MKKYYAPFAPTAIILLTCRRAAAFEVPEIGGEPLFGETADRIMSGGFSMDPSGLLSSLADAAFGELRSFSASAAAILVMTLLSSAVGALSSALGENEGSRASFFVFFTIVSGLALECFHTALSYGVEVIGRMTSFMDKLTPALMLTLFACCKSAGAAAFEPVLSAAVYAVSVITERCLVPLMTFSAVLAVAGNVGEGSELSGFARVIRSLTRWLMALVITLFTGVNAIYGFTTSALDAVGAKTVKFAVGSLVPVVGGFLSDTLDTVASSAKLLKNAVGVSGMVVIASICAVPVLKLGIMQLVLKLCAAVVEPVADRRVTGMIWEMSGAVASVFGAAALTAVLFLINICLILAAN